MNPYPDAATRRDEALADELMREQADDTAAFVAAVKALQKVLDRPFRLGSPVIGWDFKDIEGHLGEWLQLRDEKYQDAIDLVRS